MGKIIPIGSKHRSVRSMLAEVMEDNPAKCWVITMDGEGNIGWGHHDMTRAETAYAGALLTRLAFDEVL